MSRRLRTNAYNQNSNREINRFVYHIPTHSLLRCIRIYVHGNTMWCDVRYVSFDYIVSDSNNALRLSNFGGVLLIAVTVHVELVHNTFGTYFCGLVPKNTQKKKLCVLLLIFHFIRSLARFIRFSRANILTAQNWSIWNSLVIWCYFFLILLHFFPFQSPLRVLFSISGVNLFI